MSLTQIPSNQLIDNSHLSDKQNDPLQFSDQLTHAEPQSLLLQYHNNYKSNYESKSKPFQSIANMTSPKHNPNKTISETTKLKQLQVAPQYLRKVLSPQVQASKQPLKVLINKSTHQQHLQHNAIQYTAQPTQVNPTKTFKSIKAKSKLKPISVDQNHQNQAKETSNIFMPHDLHDQPLTLDNPKKYHPLEMTKSQLFQTPSIFQQCSHVMKSIKKNYRIEHVFNRHNSCAFSQPVNFHLPTKNSESLWSEKTSRFLSSQFKVYLNKKEQKHALGTLKSNFIGSIYNFYPINSEAIQFSIVFKSEDQKSSQSFRYSEIYINKGLIEGEGNQHLIPYEKMESLEGLYLVNKSTESNHQKTQIKRICAKVPVWSSKQKCYGLKFPKATMASSKNTILEDEDGKQVLKFFKNSYLTYNVTFENPISWIVAYCYGLASTDFKLFTE